MRENTEQNNAEYGHFLRSVEVTYSYQILYYVLSAVNKTVVRQTGIKSDSYTSVRSRKFDWKKKLILHEDLRKVFLGRRKAASLKNYLEVLFSSSKKSE